ncbi:MAG: exodeoxyribonuclease VII large subunit [Clostridia bacterium]|nr:exodeoxyribonuclease VII large subunit [Clostridia bacterium]
MEYIFDDYGNELLPVPKTVSQVNEYIKYLIEEEVMLQDIYVSGEVSNFKKHSSGHYYFTLKDKSSEIKAIMFRSYAQKVKFKIENGLKVVVHARISVFEQAGIYQLYVNSIEPEGIGSLNLAYEQLKEKLFKEGLFDDKYKKPLPKFPLKIGVITSPTGAAIKDIINVATRRFPLASIILYPSLVQGEDAPNELISGIDYFNITNSVDVIIIGRGGGSIEDLWAFNDETLARTIFGSKIPVISGVGHEIDFTICDFVADVRAATPSAAAELATPNLEESISKINSFKSRSISVLQAKIIESKSRLNSICSMKVLKKPETILEIPKIKLENIKSDLVNSIKNRISSTKSTFTNTVSKINALNPLSVLTRGFSVVSNSSGAVVKSIKQVSINSEINIKLSDGAIKASVISKERTDK